MFFLNWGQLWANVLVEYKNVFLIRGIFLTGGIFLYLGTNGCKCVSGIWNFILIGGIFLNRGQMDVLVEFENVF